MSHDQPHPEPLTLTVAQAAQLLGISRDHAYDHIRQHQLPADRLGSRLVVPRVALIALLSNTGAADPRGHVTVTRPGGSSLSPATAGAQRIDRRTAGKDRSTTNLPASPEGR